MTRAPWEDTTVSAVMLRRLPLAYNQDAWVRCVQSVLDQNLAVHELIVIDTGPEAHWRRSDNPHLPMSKGVQAPQPPLAMGSRPPRTSRVEGSHALRVKGSQPPRPPSVKGGLGGVPRLPDDDRIKYLTDGYDDLAAGLHAGFEAAAGAYILLVLNDSAAVFLRSAAVQTMLMVATRRPGVGMVYGDYEVCDESAGAMTPPNPPHQRVDGEMNPFSSKRLLDYHPGRLRETFDVGPVWLLDADTLKRAGGVNPAYHWAHLYDLRLRISERSQVVHVGNKFAGALYTVAVRPAEHNVFDYLMTDRGAQREYERALTEHLQRIGAYLPPKRVVRRAPMVRTESSQPAAGPTAAAPSESVRVAGLQPAADHAVDGGGDWRRVASVVIPVHHRPEFIGAAIESVLAQTVRNVEVIVVVNGGEDDPTCVAVRRYMPGGDLYASPGPDVRLLVVDVNNLGLCLNAGIAAACGKYYVQLDSDDRLKPTAVAKLLEVFESDPTIGMVIGSYEVWELDPLSGKVKRKADMPIVTHDEWTNDNGPNNLLRINGAGAPRSAHIEVIKEVGWFSVNDTPHSRNYGEDYDLVLRISERYRIGRVWEPIYEVIRHPGGTDHSIDQATRNRNDDAKDSMRLEALHRRQEINRDAAES